MLLNGIQFTPFQPIDKQLLSIDQWMHFSTPGFIALEGASSCLARIFGAFLFMIILRAISYSFKYYLDSEKIERLSFFMTMLISILMGGLFYYFFPTEAPVSLIKSPDFVPEVYAPYLKFYQVHHYQLVTSGETGVIAFPSFHVVWAVLLCYSLRSKRYLFYPLVFINLGVLASTLLLGWHYCVDVIGGLVVALFSILIVNYIYAHYSAKCENRILGGNEYRKEKK